VPPAPRAAEAPKHGVVGGEDDERRPPLLDDLEQGDIGAWADDGQVLDVDAEVGAVLVDPA
jgi:hypothetical protein